MVRDGDADFRERLVFGSVIGGRSTGPLPSSNACELPKPGIADLFCPFLGHVDTVSSAIIPQASGTPTKEQGKVC